MPNTTIGRLWPMSGVHLPLFNLFSAPSKLPHLGIPLGREIYTGQIVYFDPWLLKNQSYVNALIVMILGEIEHGKSALAKVLAMRLSVLAMGNEKMRIWLSDSRQVDGTPEYHALLDFFGSKEVALARHPLNVLDPAMQLSLSENCNMIAIMAEYIGGEALTTMQHTAVNAAMAKLLDREPLPTLEKLVEVLATVHTGDIHDGMVLDNVSDELFREGAGEIMLRLNRILSGDIGRVFGGSHSLAEALTQQVVGIDYTDVDARSMDLVQAMLWLWKTSAHRRRDPRFSWHMEVHDENYKDWRSEVYANELSKYVKMIRSTGSMIILAAHRLNDYATVGDVGSAQRALATNLAADVSIWFIGKQKPADAKDLGERLRLSRKHVEAIQQLPPHHFLLKIGGHEPIIFHLMLTEDEKAITFTNQAALRYATR